MWWRRCIIHSGVVFLLWSIFVAYCCLSNEGCTIQGIMHIYSFCFITIWALSIMRGTDSKGIIFYPRLLFFPFVLLMVAFSYWYSGEAYLDLFVIVIMASLWLLPFLFDLSGKKTWLRILLMSIAGLVTFSGFRIIPTISGVERLRSGNQRLLRYSDIVLDGRSCSVSEIKVLTDSKSILRIEINAMGNTEGLFGVISTISRLEKLILRDMKIDGKELKQLATLKNLKTIIFENIEIFDGDILGIQSCKCLETLILRNTYISVSGHKNDLLEIVKMPNLKQVILGNIDVPKETLHEIKKINPELEFRYYPPSKKI